MKVVALKIGPVTLMPTVLTDLLSLLNGLIENIFLTISVVARIFDFTAQWRTETDRK